MGNIIYDGNSKEVELSGKNIAEVREMYGSEFDMPDRARVKLNGKWLKRKHEAGVVLSDGDELCFAQRSMKPLAIIGSFLLALVLTGAIFAYTQTTTTTTITVTDGGADYCSITANTTYNPDYTLMGRYRGVITEGTLFNVTPDTNYTGDLVVNVYLNNADQLQNDYSSWMMRVQLCDSSNNTIDVSTSTEIISLDTTMATFEVEYSGYSGEGEAYIHCDGGSYKTYGIGWITTPSNPSIYAQVVQAGDH